MLLYIIYIIKLTGVQTTYHNFVSICSDRKPIVFGLSLIFCFQYLFNSSTVSRCFTVRFLICSIHFFLRNLRKIMLFCMSKQKSGQHMFSVPLYRNVQDFSDKQKHLGNQKCGLTKVKGTQRQFFLKGLLIVLRASRCIQFLRVQPRYFYQ